MAECSKIKRNRQCDDETVHQLRLVVLLDKDRNCKVTKEKVHSCPCIRDPPPSPRSCPPDSPQPTKRRIVASPAHHTPPAPPPPEVFCCCKKLGQAEPPPQIFQYQGFASPMVPCSGDQWQCMGPEILVPVQVEEVIVGPPLQPFPVNRAPPPVHHPMMASPVAPAPCPLAKESRKTSRVKPIISRKCPQVPRKEAQVQVCPPAVQATQVPSPTQLLSQGLADKSTPSGDHWQYKGELGKLASIQESQILSAKASQTSHGIQSSRMTVSARESQIPVSAMPRMKPRMGPSVKPSVSTKSSRMTSSIKVAETSTPPMEEMAKSQVAPSQQTSAQASQIKTTAAPSQLPPIDEESQVKLLSAIQSQLASSAVQSQSLNIQSQMILSAIQSQLTSSDALSEFQATVVQPSQCPGETTAVPSCQETTVVTSCQEATVFESVCESPLPLECSAAMSVEAAVIPSSVCEATVVVPSSLECQEATAVESVVTLPEECEAVVVQSESECEPSQPESCVQPSSVGTIIVAPEKASEIPATISIKACAATAQSVQESEVLASPRSSRMTPSITEKSSTIPVTAAVEESTVSSRIPPSTKASELPSSQRIPSLAASSFPPVPSTSSAAPSQPFEVPSQMAPLISAIQSQLSSQPLNVKSQITLLSAVASTVVPSHSRTVIPSKMVLSAIQFEMESSAAITTVVPSSSAIATAAPSEERVASTKSKSSRITPFIAQECSTKSSRIIIALPAQQSIVSSRIPPPPSTKTSEMTPSAKQSKMSVSATAKPSTVDCGSGAGEDDDNCSFGWPSWSTFDKIIDLLNGEPMCAPNLCECSCKKDGEDKSAEKKDVAGSAANASSGDSLDMTENPETCAVMIALPIVCLGVLASYNQIC